MVQTTSVSKAHLVTTDEENELRDLWLVVKVRGRCLLSNLRAMVSPQILTVTRNLPTTSYQKPLRNSRSTLLPVFSSSQVQILRSKTLEMTNPVKIGHGAVENI